MCSEGERYDNVERVDTRCIGRRREEKIAGVGGYEGCPRKNRKFRRVVEIRGEQRGEEDAARGAGEVVAEERVTPRLLA